MLKRRRALAPILSRCALFGLLAAALLIAPAMTAVAGPRDDDAEAARVGENATERIVARFGPEYEGLAEKIDIALRKGVEWLSAQQKADGSFDCYAAAKPTGYPIGGTSLCLLAIKKSMVGLYPGDERDLKKEIRNLEKVEKKDELTPDEARHLEYLRNRAADEIVYREELKKKVDKGLQWLRNYYKTAKEPIPNRAAMGGQTVDGLTTYCVGVLLMLLEGYYTEVTIERDGYAMGLNARNIPQGDLDWIRELVAWLEKCQKLNKSAGRENEVWRYPGAAQDGHLVDNSNTQYAVLGLKAAQRMGVNITDPQVWLDVCNFYLRTQDQDGPEVKREPVAEDPASGEYYFPKAPGEVGSDRARGWSYLPVRDAHHPSTGAMTTAALAALITAKSALYESNLFPRMKDLEEKVDTSINDGLCWLGHHFSVTSNPVAQGSMGVGWHYYYLYGLERAGILAQTEAMGKHFWYPEGATYLVGAQRPDGSWQEGQGVAHPGAGAMGNQLADSCFAILFLKRATTPVNVPLKVPRPVITEDSDD